MKRRLTTRGDVQVGRIVIQLTQLAATHDIRVPTELTLLGKTLLSLDDIARTLNPTFDPNACVRRNAAEMIQQRLLKSVTPGNIFASVLEAKEFVQHLPVRVNRILDALAESRLKVKVDVTDQGELLSGLRIREPHRAWSRACRAHRRRRDAHAGPDDLQDLRLSGICDPLLHCCHERRRLACPSPSS